MPRITFGRMEVDPPAEAGSSALPLAECFPEMMTLDQLQETLIRFNVSFDFTTPKEDLLQLYRESLCPKPQREKTRSNRRGQQIQLSKIRLEQRKRKQQHDGNLGVQKQAKFTLAESLHNSSLGQLQTHDPIHVNGRLKPPPSISGKSLTDSKAFDKSLDTLAHIKINEGPSKHRNQQQRPQQKQQQQQQLKQQQQRPKLQRPKEGSNSDNSGSVAVDCKFWDMFGSVTGVSVSLKTGEDVTALRDPVLNLKQQQKSSASSLMEIQPRRVLKLNRQTVLPGEIEGAAAGSTTVCQKKESAKPMCSKSPSPSAFKESMASDSSSDMDTSEPTILKKPKTQKFTKITWP